MNRLFVFGCSYTNFRWPTWAEITYTMLRDHGYINEFYQYGISGAGNELIARTVELADAVHTFTPADTIIVNFTHWDRIDSWGMRLNAGDMWPSWNVGGNWLHNGIHGMDFRLYYSEVNNILNNKHWIQYITERYPNTIILGSNYYITEPEGNSTLSAVNDFEQYMYTESMKSDENNLLSSRYCINKNLKTSWFWDNRLDTHPSIMDHCDFVCSALHERLWKPLDIDADSYLERTYECEKEYSSAVAENLGLPYTEETKTYRDDWYSVDVDENIRARWSEYDQNDSHDDIFKSYGIQPPNSNQGLNLWYNESNLGKDLLNIVQRKT